MTRKLSHTKVAQRADEIFAGVGCRRVKLLSAGTGSGKSLFSPTRVWEELRGPVLVLAPSVDVAHDNAARIADLSDYGWKIGVEVGIHTGRRKERGECVVVATYGSFIQSKSLQNRRWAAILLDESHVEQTDVEIARADVHDRLEAGENLFVMELSATMDVQKLRTYWESSHVQVDYHELDGAGTDFQRELIEVSTSTNELADTIIKTTSDRIAAGDRLVMVVQPGLQDVEEIAEKLEEKLGSWANVYRYHGDTDPDDVAEIISSINEGERRVIVTTPRLLTGFNHQDLDTVITCGRAKYPESDARGSSMLRLGSMSQAELIQALGRVGRFKDGQLILCSDEKFAGRRPVIVPEVERMSSLPLALSLVAMGRNPLTIRFCNQPKELRQSMWQLKEWDFIDDDLDITSEGIEASKLDIRPDLTRFLLSVKNNPASSKNELAAAVVVAAVSHSGNITLRKLVKDNRPISVPVLNFNSDLYNEAMRFLQAVQWDKKQVKDAGWISFRSLQRAKSIIYRLVNDLDDNRLWEVLGEIFVEDTKKKVKASKKKEVEESPRQKAWRKVGQSMFGQFSATQKCLNIALIQAMKHNLYRGMDGLRGVCGVQLGESVGVGNDSVVSVRGAVFLAHQTIITPRHGGNPFSILTGITKVTPEELVEADPKRFQIDNSTAWNPFERTEVREKLLYVNGVSFHTFEDWRRTEAA